MYHDQLNIIATHLQTLKLETQLQHHTNGSDKILPHAAKLTRRILKEQEDWTQWQTAEDTQLNQYEHT